MRGGAAVAEADEICEQLYGGPFDGAVIRSSVQWPRVWVPLDLQKAIGVFGTYVYRRELADERLRFLREESKHQDVDVQE
jgi:hypothetical protein